MGPAEGCWQLAGRYSCVVPSTHPNSASGSARARPRSIALSPSPRPAAESEASFPLAALFAVAITIALALRQILRTVGPLDALIQATRSLSAGRLGVRVEVETRNEFRDLAASFNSMAGEIEGR